MYNNKEYLDQYSAIELYEMLLSNQIKRFPRNFWKNDFSLDYADELGKYVINKFLDDDTNKILNEYDCKFVNKVRLHSALKLFNGSAFEYIDFLYPNRFKPWDFKKTPNAYWNDENGIKATKWLIEDCLKWNETDVKEKLCYKTFASHNLNGMLAILYNDSPYMALNAAYPDKYKPLDFKYSPNNNLFKNNLQEINKEKFNQYSPIEIYEKVLSKQINQFPAGFWENDFSLDYAKELGKYAINKFLDNDNTKILNEYGTNFINNIGLYSILKLFKNAFEYIDFLYPNRFKPWDFKKTPNAYWSDENGVKATKWLIEDYLKWNETDVKEKLCYKTFASHNLNGMLAILYNDSPYKALNAAYPDKYKEWDLKRVPINFWKNRENVKNALKWLIEDKLNLSPKEIPKKLTTSLIKKYGLSGLLRWYKGIPFDILIELYPNINWTKIKK